MPERDHPYAQFELVTGVVIPGGRRVCQLVRLERMV